MDGKIKPRQLESPNRAFNNFRVSQWAFVSFIEFVDQRALRLETFVKYFVGHSPKKLPCKVKFDRLDSQLGFTDLRTTHSIGGMANDYVRLIDPFFIRDVSLIDFLFFRVVSTIYSDTVFWTCHTNSSH